MSRCRQLPDLCLAGTRVLLIEMPFERWSESVISEVLEIRAATGLIPIIAHIERYIGYQRGSTLGRLIEGGVLIQSNCEYFTDRKTRKKALKLLQQGEIHLLGTDAHGMTERVPNMINGAEIILNAKFGEEMLDEIARCSEFVLRTATPVKLPETANL